MGPLDQLDWDRVQSHFARLDELGREQLARDGVPEAAIELRHFADCRYANQGYELMVPAAELELGSDGWAAAVAEAFGAEHERQYSRRFDGAVELVNLRVIAVGRRPTLQWPRLERGDGRPERALRHEQEVVFVVRGSRERHTARGSSTGPRLRAGRRVAGPRGDRAVRLDHDRRPRHRVPRGRRMATCSLEV